MIFAMRSGREKIILSDLKNPPDRLKKHVPGNTQFLCHKKPKLKQYIIKFPFCPVRKIFILTNDFFHAIERKLT